MSRKRVVVVSDHLKQYADLRLERGQIFELQDKLNDLKLMGWNYIRELEPKEETYSCKCGREFIGGVTDPWAREHTRKWQGDCSPKIDVDGVNLKGKPPILKGGGNPDAEGPGWDLGVGGKGGPPVDPYAGERVGAKERPRRVSLGG